MGDRIDEAKGVLKENLGDVTGNEELEREGSAEKNAAKTRREARDAVNESRGKAAASEPDGGAPDEDPAHDAERASSTAKPITAHNER